MLDHISDTGSATGQVQRKSAPIGRAQSLLSEAHNGLPVWVRAPRTNSVESYSGLSRAKLYELATEGHIRSVSIRKPGQIKGTRLFNLGSILGFIEKQEKEFALSGGAR